MMQQLFKTAAMVMATARTPTLARHSVCNVQAVVARALPMTRSMPLATDLAGASSSSSLQQAAAAAAAVARPVTVQEAAAALIPSIVYAGVPKHKKSPFQKKKATYGIHFKHNNLRLSSWYYCPLCAEPKQTGSCCRREDCRQIKP